MQSVRIQKISEEDNIWGLLQNTFMAFVVWEISRKSIFISAIAEGQSTGAKGNAAAGKGAGRGAGFLLLRTISYFTYEMANNQSKTARRAVLGSIGKDAVASGSSGWIPYIHFISEI